MVFKNFHIRLTIYVVTIITTLLFFFWLWFTGQQIIFVIHVALLVVVEVVLFIRFLNRWNRELYNFFAMLKGSQFEWGGALDDTQLSAIKIPLLELKNRLRKQKQQQEVENEYYRVMSRNIASGLLVIDDDEKVIFSNPSAVQLLGIPAIRNLESLERKMKGARDFLSSFRAGEVKQLLWRTGEASVTLQFKIAGFISEGRHYKIISFDNIQPAINRKEVESWQKLLRVLNHEIMNSVGPINSTAELLMDKWQTANHAVDKSDKLIQKTLKGLEVIGERSRGLSDFVKAYRSLTKIQVPEKLEVQIWKLVDHTAGLLTNQLSEKKIKLQFDFPENSILITDPGFLQQILINLVINSVEAFDTSVQSNPVIRISLRNDQDQRIISVKDNGNGMDNEVLEKCTVPFYTTKETGSGIGLSLARQLMQALDGSMEIQSVPNSGTEVRLCFP
nr:HAMP domain-containing histidine kinase [Bacteroidota bacterium]